MTSGPTPDLRYDYTTTINDLGLTHATWSQGDFNGDGIVDQQDVDLLLSNNPSLDPKPTAAAFFLTAAFIAIKREH